MAAELSKVVDPQYKDAIEQECTLNHGYVCKEISEDNFLTPNPDRIMVPGNWLAAWQIAAADFQVNPDTDDEQKKLKHYKVGFTESDTSYVVLFNPLLLPSSEESSLKVSTQTVGIGTKYWIDKKTMSISKRLYLK